MKSNRKRSWMILSLLFLIILAIPMPDIKASQKTYQVILKCATTDSSTVFTTQTLYAYQIAGEDGKTIEPYQSEVTNPEDEAAYALSLERYIQEKKIQAQAAAYADENGIAVFYLPAGTYLITGSVVEDAQNQRYQPVPFLIRAGAETASGYIKYEKPVEKSWWYQKLAEIPRFLPKTGDLSNMPYVAMLLAGVSVLLMGVGIRIRLSHIQKKSRRENTDEK